jgi:hypothetical protein
MLYPCRFSLVFPTRSDDSVVSADREGHLPRAAAFPVERPQVPRMDSLGDGGAFRGQLDERGSLIDLLCQMILLVGLPALVAGSAVLLALIWFGSR